MVYKEAHTNPIYDFEDIVKNCQPTASRRNSLLWQLQIILKVTHMLPTVY